MSCRGLEPFLCVYGKTSSHFITAMCVLCYPQRAVKALNGLQTSAEVLEQKREQQLKGDDVELQALKEQRRTDEHCHREARAKLLQTKTYLEQSGIQVKSILVHVRLITVNPWK